MPNRFQGNGAGCIVAPSIGPCVGNKVSVLWHDGYWSGDSYLFSQASLSSGTREFGLFRESSGTVLKFLAAGQPAVAISNNVAADFGQQAFEGFGVFTLDYTTGQWWITANNITKSGTATLGTSRLASTYFRIGGRAGSDTVGNMLSTYVMPSGNWVGDVEVYVNDAKTREFRIPSTGETVKDYVSGQHGTLVSGNASSWYTLPAPVGSGYTNYVFVGASITEHTLDYGGMSRDLESKLAALGINAVVHQRAIGGHDSADLLAGLSAHLAAFEGLESNTVFIVDIGGNDVSDSGPYPGGASTLETNYRSIITQIKAAGFRVLPCSISYRVPPASNPAESYNTGVIVPAIQELAPEAMSGDRPYIDLHAVSLDNVGTWHEVDGIHPSPEGEELTRAYYAARIAATLAVPGVAVGAMTRVMTRVMSRSMSRSMG